MGDSKSKQNSRETIKTEGFSYSPSCGHCPFIVNCGQFGFVDNGNRQTDRQQIETYGIILKAVPNSGKTELYILEHNKA